jgi:hypothetical protein
MATLSCPNCHSQLNLGLIPAVELPPPKFPDYQSQPSIVNSSTAEPSVEIIPLQGAKDRIIQLYTDIGFTLRGHDFHISPNDLLETAISYPDSIREYANVIVLNSGKPNERHVSVRKTVVDTLCRKYPGIDWPKLNITSGDAIRIARKCVLDINSRGGSEHRAFYGNGSSVMCDVRENEAAKDMVLTDDPDFSWDTTFGKVYLSNGPNK